MCIFWKKKKTENVEIKENKMIPSKNAIDLIKEFEGCKLEAYQDVVGVWTVGYGTTGPGIVEGLTITQATAEAMLKGHVNEIGLSLTDCVGNTLSQDKFDACVSFIYNLGIGNFKKSTLLKLIKEGKLKEAGDEFPKWNKAGGKILPGLVRRREAERQLFLRS